MTIVNVLRERRDWGTEELLFAHSGERVRVSFLDDSAMCSPSELTEELETLLATQKMA